MHLKKFVKAINYEIADYNFEREHNIIVIVKTLLQDSAYSYRKSAGPNC